MKIVRPSTITDSVFTSSTILETAPAAYNGATTYALNDVVSVTTGTTSVIYRSLQSGNTGNAPASSPSWWKELGTTYSAYSGATTYAAEARVIDTTNHLVYQSVTGGNTGHALTDTAWWTEVGPTNRWAMFDSKTSTVASWAETVEMTFTLTSRVDSIALLEISASSVTLSVSDGVDEVYNETVSLIDYSGITDWWSYFFDPIEFKTAMVQFDLPNISNPVITVTLTASTSGSVSLGHMILGSAKDLGGTQYGAKVGIIDYSGKKTDTFGNWYIVERGYSRKGQFTVWVPRASQDGVYNLLATYRAQPVLVVGASEYTSTYIFGLLSDWDIAIQYHDYSVMTLTVDGF